MAQKDHPINEVKWIPIEDVHSNLYNPNSVATNEMQLLYISIKADGYTQPIVVVWDDEIKKYVVVDGHHRSTICRLYADIRESTEGCIPCVVLKKDINDRMASTVRHNRARGKHSIVGMANIVFKMLDNGKDDAAICKELGLETDELLRLKHITGFSKLFESVEYRQAWVTKKMIQAEKGYQNAD
jgi:ParB-like chromosome segregation protein Spo0J